MAILLGCIIGAIIGNFAPIISYTYSEYLAIAIVAALDTIFGGIVASIKKNFNMGVFISGFLGNALLSILLTYLGSRLNVDIYLAAIFVFVGRIFFNLGVIRRYYLEKCTNYIKSKKDKKAKKEIKN
ncbi:MAG: small basic family protein [Clostridia bacterium]|nr:small basic family protein [Clostridia bacterium]